MNENVEIKKELTSLRNENEKIKNENVKTRNENVEIKKELTKLQNEIAEIKNGNIEIKKDLTSLQNENEGTNDENEGTNDENEETNDENEETNDENEETNNENEETNNENEETNNENEETKHENAETLDENDDIKNDHTGFRKENDEIKKNLILSTQQEIDELVKEEEQDTSNEEKQETQKKIRSATRIHRITRIEDLYEECKNSEYAISFKQIEEEPKDGDYIKKITFYHLNSVNALIVDMPDDVAMKWDWRKANARIRKDLGLYSCLVFYFKNDLQLNLEQIKEIIKFGSIGPDHNIIIEEDNIKFTIGVLCNFSNFSSNIDEVLKYANAIRNNKRLDDVEKGARAMESVLIFFKQSEIQTKDCKILFGISNKTVFKDVILEVEKKYYNIISSSQ